MSTAMNPRHLAVVVCIGLALLFALPVQAQQADRNKAPGFTTLPRETQVVLMPTDIELFSISAGGVRNPVLIGLMPQPNTSRPR